MSFRRGRDFVLLIGIFLRSFAVLVAEKSGHIIFTHILRSIYRIFWPPGGVVAGIIQQQYLCDSVRRNNGIVTSGRETVVQSRREQESFIKIVTRYINTQYSFVLSPGATAARLKTSRSGAM